MDDDLRDFVSVASPWKSNLGGNHQQLLDTPNDQILDVGKGREGQRIAQDERGS